MRSHRKRSPLDHVLVAGEFEELDTVATILALLPDDAYGQVYIECAEGQVLPDLHRPARVGIVALPAGQVPGGRLRAAVDAWLAEWMPEEVPADRQFAIWVGAGIADHVGAPGLPLSMI